MLAVAATRVMGDKFFCTRRQANAKGISFGLGDKFFCTRQQANAKGIMLRSQRNTRAEPRAESALSVILFAFVRSVVRSAQ